MDVSDIKLLQTIYYILASSISIRKRMSLYEFRSFLLTELRKQKIRIDLIDEEIPLFVANHQIVLFFPDYEQDERQILVFLFELMIPFAETFVIYGQGRTETNGPERPNMDVSDVSILQTIYYILASSVSIRKRMSLYEFKSFLLIGDMIYASNILSMLSWWYGLS